MTEVKRAATVALLLLLLGSSLLGAIGLAASPEAGRRAILSPLQFQLNGKDPYVVRLQLSRGEKVSCEVSTGADAVSLLLVFNGVVLWSSSFSGHREYQVLAGSSGSYALTFESSSPSRVWVSLFTA